MKKIYLLLLLILITSVSNLSAQIAFSREYGGAYNEDGRWMEQMPDSGYIMTGGTSTFSNGQTDIWLVRTDPFGNTMWTKSIGGAAFDFANMVKPISGGLVICGVTNRNGDDDAIIIKTNLTGNTIWETVLGGSGIQWFEGVIQTSDGGFAAVGVNTGAGTHGTYDIWLVKFDANGVKLWDKNIGGQSYEIGNSIQETSDGGFILSGQTYSYGALDGDYYLVKTNSTGVVQWEQTYAETGLQEAHYAQITPDGGYILIGDADGLSNGLGGTDIWVIKTDDQGNIDWEEVYGGNKKDGGKTIENTSDGGYIAAGITRSFGLINPNYYLLKLDNAGNLEWQKTDYGTDRHDHAYRAIETSDYGFAEFGYFKNNSDFKNFALVKLPPNAGIVKDISIDNITAPITTMCRSNNVELSVMITNYGGVNEQNIIVNLVITQGSNVSTLTDTLTGILAPAATATLNFTQRFDFNTDGVYNIKAFTPHRNSDISYTNDTNNISINVIPPVIDPVTVSSLSCNNGAFNLSATPGQAGDSLFWYDAATSGELVSTGINYTTPSISNTQTYYVVGKKGIGHKTAKLDNSGPGSTSSGNYLKFDSRRKFKLVSVLVYSTAAGSRTIQLRNSSNTVLQQKTVNIPVAAGGYRVYLDFDVPQANDLQLYLTSGSEKLFRNSSGALYPYDISQTIEIFGASSSTADTYYYFYDWYIFVPSQNCYSNSVPVQAIIGNSSTTAFNQSRCGNGSVTLQANSNTSVAWYSTSTGGSPLSTSSNFTTPVLSSTTTYYVEASSCPNRIAVSAIINQVSSAPSASDQSRCGPGSITLNATSSDPVFWYNAPPPTGTLSHSGSSFNTPFLNSTTTYYAVAGAVCPSTPVTVNAIINGSASPVVSSANACGPASVTLTAIASDPVAWFTSPAGGSPISTNPNYSTPVLSSPVTYYVEAGTSCPSPRVPVTANVVTIDPPVVSGASRCGAGTLVVSAQSMNTITWWSAPTGGNQLSTGAIFTTPSLSSTTIFYAMASGSGCNSSRTSVTATVVITQPPVPSQGAHCGPGHVILTATANDSIFWYSASTGGSPLGNGPSYTTPTISNTITYYVQAGGVCPSTRVAVNAVITSQAADPVTTDSSRCGPGTVVLTAISNDPITWYDTPNGTVVGTGNILTTPVITQTETFYAVAGIPGCVSDPVVALASVNPKPADPTVTGDSNCGPATLTLLASSNDDITWYSQASGGTILETGSDYTATFNTTTTVYVDATKGNCVSNRVPVIASIYNNPVINLGPPLVVINSGQTITLDPGAGFTSYDWSTNATTQTINVNTSGTYYVVVTDIHNCQGSDTITVNVITGVTENALDAALEVYPNPTNGLVTISIAKSSLEFILNVTDVEGRLILSDSQKFSGIFNKNYDLSHLAKGVYYLRILSNDGNTTRPIVIQ